jgi:hypothetical protein
VLVNGKREIVKNHAQLGAIILLDLKQRSRKRSAWGTLKITIFF